eukprot:1162888-Pleurochrysis_carterae.AAC.1
MGFHDGAHCRARDADSVEGCPIGGVPRNVLLALGVICRDVLASLTKFDVRLFSGRSFGLGLAPGHLGESAA